MITKVNIRVECCSVWSDGLYPATSTSNISGTLSDRVSGAREGVINYHNPRLKYLLRINLHRSKCYWVGFILQIHGGVRNYNLGLMIINDPSPCRLYRLCRLTSRGIFHPSPSPQQTIKWQDTQHKYYSRSIWDPSPTQHFYILGFYPTLEA